MLEESKVYQSLKSFYLGTNNLFNIPINMNVCKVLDIPPSSLKDYKILKSKFLECCKNLNLNEEKCIAIEMAMQQETKKYIKEDGQINLMISEQSELQDQIPCLLIIQNKIEIFKSLMFLLGTNDFIDSYDRNIVYLASKFKRIEILQFSIFNGADIDYQQNTGSTPLHTASFYGNNDIVKLLIMFGADISLKNNYGSIPQDEAATPMIKDLFIQNDHQITSFLRELRCHVKKNDNEFSLRHTYLKMCFLKDKQQNHIGWYVTNPYLTENKRNYYSEECYHGTKLQNVISIFQNNLKVPGESTAQGFKIEIVKGHIPEQQIVKNIPNFAKAVFVSPSPFYSSDPTYSEQIKLPNGERYCVILKAYAMKNSMKIVEATTTPKYQTRDGEEYSQMEWRIPSSEFIMVQGVYFISEKVMRQSKSIAEVKENLQQTIEANSLYTFKEVAQLFNLNLLPQGKQEKVEVAQLFNPNLLSQGNQVKVRLFVNGSGFGSPQMYPLNFTLRQILIANGYHQNYYIRIQNRRFCLDQTLGEILQKVNEKSILVIMFFEIHVGG